MNNEILYVMPDGQSFTSREDLANAYDIDINVLSEAEDQIETVQFACRLIAERDVTDISSTIVHLTAKQTMLNLLVTTAKTVYINGVPFLKFDTEDTAVREALEYIDICPNCINSKPLTYLDFQELYQHIEALILTYKIGFNFLLTLDEQTRWHSIAQQMFNARLETI